MTLCLTSVQMLGICSLAFQDLIFYNTRNYVYNLLVEHTGYLFTEVVSATEGSDFLLLAVSFLGHSHLQYRIQYSTVQDTVQYSTVQYSTVQYITVEYRIQYSTVQYSHSHLSIRDDVKSVARGSLPDNVVA